MTNPKACRLKRPPRPRHELTAARQLLLHATLHLLPRRHWPPHIGRAAVDGAASGILSQLLEGAGLFDATDLLQRMRGVDWSTRNCTRFVQRQGNCRACWVSLISSGLLPTYPLSRAPCSIPTTWRLGTPGRGPTLPPFVPPGVKDFNGLPMKPPHIALEGHCRPLPSA